MLFRVCLLGIVLTLAHTATAGDWPRWRGPNLDGISTETGWRTDWPAGGPKQLWKTNVGIGCSSFTISKGRAYTMGNKDDKDTIYCFDAVTGKPIWKHTYDCELAPKYYEGGTSMSPTVDGSLVFTVSKEGHVFCLQAETGKVMWAKHLQKDFGGKMPTWGYAGSPLVLGQTLLLEAGGKGSSLVALGKTMGNVMWRVGEDGAGYGSIMPFNYMGKVCLAIFNAFGPVVREATTGKEIARHPWNTKYDVNAATPIISKDTIFISSGYGTGAALLQLNPPGMKVVWQSKVMRNHFNSCILWKDHLYGFDESTFKCIEYATGKEKWARDDLGKGSLMLADGKLIIQGESGDLVLAEPTPLAYREIARAKVLSGKCWVVPVLANGRIYCKNNAGDVVCLDVSGK